MHGVYSAVLCSCSGGSESDNPSPPPALEVVPSPSPEPGCRLFFQDTVALPNANVRLEPDAVYERAVVLAPGRLGWVVSYGNASEAESSRVLFDGAGLIAESVGADDAETLGRLGQCVQETAPGPEVVREYEVLATPTPPQETSR